VACTVSIFCPTAGGIENASHTEILTLPRTDQNPIVLAANHIARLATSIAGTILVPGRYDLRCRRRVWYGMVDKRPALIARCAHTADVIACTRFAREHDLLVSVRGGGHNYAGSSVSEGGMMIDLSTMRSVVIDPMAPELRMPRPASAWVNSTPPQASTGL
jgi:FAD binding domain